jgi:hypothetical protein
VGIIVVKLTHVIARVVKRIEVWARRRATFGTGVAAVTLLPVCWSWAPTFLCHGSRNRGVVASSSIPQGVHCFHNSCSRLVVSCADRLPQGSGRHIKNIVKKRSVSGLTPGGRCCLSFPMRTLGLRPCISMGRRSKSKQDYHLLFPTFPSRTSFK